MIYKPDSTKGVETYVDSDFAGNWDRTEARDDTDMHTRDTGTSSSTWGVPYCGSRNYKVRLHLV